MSQPLFSVSSEVFDRFPGYIVGFVVADIGSNREPSPDVETLLRNAEERARIVYEGIDLKAEPAIAVWRQAFTQLGWSASKYPASVEALVKRASRGYALPNINPAVDLGNAAALTYLVPCGCHDRELSPNLMVRPAIDGDWFLPMGVGDEEQPEAGEVVYASGQHVRTRRWVWRQSRDGLVSHDSTRLLFPIDGFEDVTGPRVETATRFLAEMLVENFGAHVVTGILNRDHPTVAIDVI